MENSATHTDTITPFDIGPGNSRNCKNNNDPDDVNQGSTNRAGAAPPGDENPGDTDSDMYYDMSGTKRMIIFNHHKFKCGGCQRDGTDEDVDSLRRLFQDSLGFDFKEHKDLDLEDIYEVILNLLDENLRNTSCLCLIFLTHGSTDGKLVANDGRYEFQKVLDLFQARPVLVNKPKLFFIQACRGSKKDKGFLGHDGIRTTSTFKTITPTHADYLLMRSTVEEFVSIRTLKGSWMIQDLCQMIEKHRRSLDLVQILSFVHQKVSRRMTKDDSKQMPETCYTLTKLLKLM